VSQFVNAHPFHYGRSIRASLLWSVSTGLAAGLIGFELTRSRGPIAVGALIAASVLAFCWPSASIIGGLTVMALPRSLDVKFQMSAMGLPLSIRDGIPFLLLGAALELRRRHSFGPLPRRQWLAAIIGLFAAGLLVGLLTGHVNGAPAIQMLRVARVEVGLIVGLCAAIVAAHVSEWRDAVRRGLMIAGGLTIIEIVFSVGFGLITGRSFWGELGLSGAVDVYGSVRSGDVNVLRSNDISTFLILPLFAVGITRISRRDGLLVAGGVLAVVMSLSRGFWVAALALALAGIAYRLGSPDTNRIGVTVKWFVVALAAGLVAAHFVGGVASTRFKQTSAFQDASSRYRTEETQIAFRTLTRDPLTTAVGTGAGVVLPLPPKSATQDPSDAVSFLENSLLSRWTNLTFLSLLATIALLISGGRVAWESRTLRECGERDLRVMGLCLPLVLVGGLGSGSDFSQGTLPFWVLAATLIVPMQQPVPEGDRL
jgi:hypothetical protein